MGWFLLSTMQINIKSYTCVVRLSNTAICNYYSFSLTKATLNVRSTFEMNETD